MDNCWPFITGWTDQQADFRSSQIEPETALVGNVKSLSRLPFDTCASAHARQNTKQTDKFLDVRKK